jgi:hypothetical protein
MVNARLRSIRYFRYIAFTAPYAVKINCVSRRPAPRKAPNQMSVARDLWHFHFALRHLLPAMHRDGT